MDLSKFMYLTSLLFFSGYLIHAQFFAKNFWSRIESLLWANIFAVSMLADKVFIQ